MKITIKTKDTDISMPVPLVMADMAIRTVPDKVFRKAAEKLGLQFKLIINEQQLI